MKGIHEDVFRKVAVDRLASPDGTTETLSILRPLDWLILAAVGLVAASAVVLASVATLPILMHGEGILWHPPGTTEIVAPQRGRVTLLHIAEGDQVAWAAPLLELWPWPDAAKTDTNSGGSWDARPTTVTAPFRAHILEVAVSAGQDVAPGQPLVTVEPGDVALEAVVFVTESVADRIRPGLEVRLALPDRPSQRRPLHGTVARVTPTPVAARSLARIVGELRAEGFLARGLHVRVDVALKTDGRDGAEAALGSGTRVDAEIEIGRERPIARVLPWTRSGA